MELHRPQEATRDDPGERAGYNLFNLGARYTPGGEQGRLTLRLYADNITDKRYWKDTGASLRRHLHTPGRADNGAALGSLHFLFVNERGGDEAMSMTAKAHGLDGSLMEPDWPPLMLAEVRSLLQCSRMREPIEIVSVSPRPFSAASVVATGSGRVLSSGITGRCATARDCLRNIAF